MSSAILGIDPSASGTGGAALLVGDTVAAWWCWTWLRGRGGRWRVRGMRHRTSQDEWEVRTLGGWATQLVGLVGRWGEDVPLLAVVEGLFVTRRRGGATGPDALALAEAAGRMLGPLEAARVEVRRPPASTWRRAFGITGRAAQCEEQAVRIARGMRWASAPSGLLPGEYGAVAEAALMAEWGRRGTLATERRREAAGDGAR